MSCSRSERQAASASSPAGARSLAGDVLHVFVLTSFAVAQPVYDRLGHRISFLMDQSISPAAVKLLVCLLSCVVPATIAAVALVLARWRRSMQEMWQSIVVFVALVFVALPISSRMNFLPGIAMVGVALTAAGLGVWSYFRFYWSRLLVTWCSPGVLLFPAMFLWQFSAATSVKGSPAVRADRWAPAPVVLLVFDEFCGLTLMNPDREIDAERFPNFAALANKSTWFRNASSVSPLTVQAVPAILSGRYPTHSESPGPADFPHNLFTALTATGDYELASFEPVSNLGKWGRVANDQPPASVSQQVGFLIGTLSRLYLFHVTPQDYHIHLPPIPPIWFGFHDSDKVDRTARRGVFEYGWADQREQQFQHFLRCLDGSPAPTLHFGHFLLPHLPWCYLPSGRVYSDDIQNSELLCLGSEGERPIDESAAAQNQQRYLLQLMYVDQLIGRLLSRLTETGMLDRYLLIITADHGVAFRAGQPRRSLTQGNQDEILSVPLFIKRPGQTRGEINDRAVELVDVLPTVADVLGISLQAPTDGWSVFDESRPARTRLTVRNGTSILHVDPAVISMSPSPSTLRRRFGLGSDRESLFQIGPAPDWIGRSIDSFEKTSDTVKISMLRFADILDRESATAKVPCFFEGLVLSDRLTDEPAIVAIAINGTIRAVTRTYRSSEFQNRFGALVPEWSLREGRNDVQFFAVSIGDGRLTPGVVVDP